MPDVSAPVVSADCKVQGEALQGLIDRLETATGPDRELDALICAALRIIPDNAPDWARKPEWRIDARRLNLDGWRVALIHSTGDIGLHWKPAEITASLDAAVGLVERVLPGWYWRCGHGSAPHWPNGRAVYGWAHVNRFHSDHCGVKDEATGYGETAAIALCLAILRALQSAPSSPPSSGGNEGGDETSGPDTK